MTRFDALAFVVLIALAVLGNFAPGLSLAILGCILSWCAGVVMADGATKRQDAALASSPG